MYRSILVPLDASDTAHRGLRHAIGLARALHVRLHLLHVVHPFLLASEVAAGATGALFEGLRRTGEELLNKAKHQAQREGVRAETMLIDAPDTPVETVILGQATAIGCDLIVMGTHGREGVSRFMLGSTAELVVRGSAIPVLLVPDPPAA